MNVLMPQLGETVTEGTISAWHKSAGEQVEKGEMLLDVETDKVSTEITAPATGVLSSIKIPEGDTVDVGTVLAVISVEGQVEEETASSATEEPAAVRSEIAAKSAGLPEKSAGDRLSPAVRRLLSEHDLDIADITGSGRDGRVTKQDVLDHIGDAG